MLRIAADPKHLGARIGITAVLHTWGSAMTHHNSGGTSAPEETVPPDTTPLDVPPETLRKSPARSRACSCDRKVQVNSCGSIPNFRRRAR
jgi:hypothetical protein